MVSSGKVGGGQDDTAQMEEKTQQFKGVTAEMVAKLQPTEARWLSEIQKWITEGESKSYGSGKTGAEPRQPDPQISEMGGEDFAGKQ